MEGDGGNTRAVRGAGPRGMAAGEQDRQPSPPQQRQRLAHHCTASRALVAGREMSSPAGVGTGGRGCQGMVSVIALGRLQQRGHAAMATSM